MKDIVEQIEAHYKKAAEEVSVEIEQNKISVRITSYEQSDTQRFAILFIEGYTVTCSASALASASWCERYGVVDELNIYITYIPN